MQPRLKAMLPWFADQATAAQAGRPIVGSPGRSRSVTASLASARIIPWAGDTIASATSGSTGNAASGPYRMP